MAIKRMRRCGLVCNGGPGCILLDEPMAGTLLGQMSRLDAEASIVWDTAIAILLTRARHGSRVRVCRTITVLDKGESFRGQQGPGQRGSHVQQVYLGTPERPDALLRVLDVTTYYGEREPVLQGVSLVVEQGTVSGTSRFGNGVGKTDACAEFDVGFTPRARRARLVFDDVETPVWRLTDMQMHIGWWQKGRRVFHRSPFTSTWRFAHRLSGTGWEEMDPAPGWGPSPRSSRWATAVEERAITVATK